MYFHTDSEQRRSPDADGATAAMAVTRRPAPRWPARRRGFGRPGGWQQADLPSAEDAAAWFTGRLPSDWFVGAPEVSVDREEIIVTGQLPPVDGEDGTRRGGRPDQPVPRGQPGRTDADRGRGRGPVRPQGGLGRRPRRRPACCSATCRCR